MQLRNILIPRLRFVPALIAAALLVPASNTVLLAQDDTGGAETGTGTESGPPANEAGSEEPQGAENAPLTDEPEITADLIDTVDRGLNYLASQQNEDGTFGTNTRYGKNVGITGLCALAFMSDGHLPGRGEYGQVVENALDFILDNSTETGLIAAQTSHGPMYGHGFATLFLGEVYGMGGGSEDPRLREALVKATRLIINTQNDDGGWRYNPLPEDADVSVTICQIMALRSARNAGIKVPKETIERAVEYVRRCQNPDGGFRYMLSPGGSNWPRSAAGVASLYYAGIYEDEAIERGVDYLMVNAFPGFRRSQAHYYYGNYYAAQAMYLAGGEYWAKWWPAARQDLIDRQDRRTGGWLDHFAGGPYGTSMALIVLQMPKRYLPIFQR